MVLSIALNQGMKRKVITGFIGLFSALSQAQTSKENFNDASVITNRLHRSSKFQCFAIPRPGISVDLTIRFEFNTDKLERSGKLQLDNLASAMNDERTKNLNFFVEVQTELNGKTSLNEALSKSRANAVIAHLIERGIAAERLQLGSKGFGYSPHSANSKSKAKSSSLVRITSSVE
jgi:hypothetical protein